MSQVQLHLSSSSNLRHCCSRRIADEKTNARVALTPFLQAEADRAIVRRQAQLSLAEEKIMGNVKVTQAFQVE